MTHSQLAIKEYSIALSSIELLGVRHLPPIVEENEQIESVDRAARVEIAGVGRRGVGAPAGGEIEQVDFIQRLRPVGVRGEDERPLVLERADIVAGTVAARHIDGFNPARIPGEIQCRVRDFSTRVHTWRVRRQPEVAVLSVHKSRIGVDASGPSPSPIRKAGVNGRGG